MLSGTGKSTQLGVKRAVDFVGALFIFMLLSPLLLVVAIAIKCEARSVFEVIVERCYGRRPISVLRFRPSKHTAHLLAESGLDRLPILINVLRGEISLVGLHRNIQVPAFLPRNELELLYASPFKPGLISLEIPRDKHPILAPIQADLYYITQWSLWLDLKVVLLRLSGL
jgi:putative colanic acid biosysnthesis UDP-glucose lipid carrier transferase